MLFIGRSLTLYNSRERLYCLTIFMRYDMNKPGAEAYTLSREEFNEFWERGASSKLALKYKQGLKEEREL